MGGAEPVRLEPHEMALLRGGPRAAVTVAVVGLYLRGAAQAGRTGTIRALEAVTDSEESPPALPPLEGAVYASLQKPCGLRELVRRSEIRLAVALMRIPLAKAGLLRYPLLGPTRGARRHVRDLQEQHPLPRSRRGLTDHDKLVAVALHGEAALPVLVPRFALRAGLIPRADVADKGMLRHSSRGGGGGSSGRGYSCGASCGSGSY
ncbi:TIGR04222 domain-containing membrane protein [Streptomyces sp. S.PNR 29]|uniref:TIGR04222 domain-containing membrane protein n=1 Tax=Streptomyces sp. S.PNR 29 TaxID=2973805 RepID=UPI0025B1A680|nr:TIGR04222 domain-containing membrane protein [Streptomyces sp. S.PNR 29]MDN0200696.1 TIGR04222 domain-containing membrane protein [Streptomyces sp. S.PNR 29]